MRIRFSHHFYSDHNYILYLWHLNGSKTKKYQYTEKLNIFAWLLMLFYAIFRFHKIPRVCVMVSKQWSGNLLCFMYFLCSCYARAKLPVSSCACDDERETWHKSNDWTTKWEKHREKSFQIETGVYLNIFKSCV